MHGRPTGQVDLEKWDQSLQGHFGVVRLFVHADYQRKGIATAICDQLEQAVQGNIVTHASATARPFFEKRGYKTIKK